LSTAVTQFHNIAPLLVLIVFPLQSIITRAIFVNNNVVKSKDQYIDKKSQKEFNESIAFFITLGGFGLIALSIIVYACLEQNSFLAFYVLLIPLVVTRSIVFYGKLPLSVLYCLLYNQTRTAQ
jgi:hypothetical protein